MWRRAGRPSGELSRMMKGELDWVVMKCLRRTDAALRDGERSGAGSSAIPGRRSGRSPAGVERLPAAEFARKNRAVLATTATIGSCRSRALR